jgi:hypothetical protein
MRACEYSEMNCACVLTNGSPPTRRVTVVTTYFGLRDSVTSGASSIGFITTQLAPVARPIPRSSLSSAAARSYATLLALCARLLTMNRPGETSTQAYSKTASATGNARILRQSCASGGKVGPTTTMT